MKNNNIDIENIELITENFGKIKSLLKCIENSLVDEFNYDRSDIMNLLSVVLDLVDDVQIKVENYKRG